MNIVVKPPSFTPVRSACSPVWILSFSAFLLVFGAVDTPPAHAEVEILSAETTVEVVLEATVSDLANSDAFQVRRQQFRTHDPLVFTPNLNLGALVDLPPDPFNDIAFSGGGGGAANLNTRRNAETGELQWQRLSAAGSVHLHTNAINAAFPLPNPAIDIASSSRASSITEISFLTSQETSVVMGWSYTTTREGAGFFSFVNDAEAISYSFDFDHETINPGESLSFTIPASSSPYTLTIDVEAFDQNLEFTDPAGVDLGQPRRSLETAYGEVELYMRPLSPPPDPDEFRWNVGGFGSFSNASNWDPQMVPGSGDTAIFALPAAYSVDVGTQTVERLRIGGDPSAEVTFENADLNVTATSPTNPGVVIDNGNFKLAGGLLASAHTVVGDSAASSATIEEGAQWQNQAQFIVGGGGEGTVTIDEGGLISPVVRIGESGNGAPGQVTLRQRGGRLVSDSLSVGGKSDGELSIESGALVNITDDLVIGGFGDGETAAVGTVNVRFVNNELGSRESALLTMGLVSRIGYEGPGNLFVRFGGRAESGGIVFVGDQGPGLLEVSGIDAASGRISRFEQPEPAGILFVGSHADGRVLVADGGILDSRGRVLVGADAPGEVQVVGVGDILPSTLSVVGEELIVGDRAEGSLFIEEGGRVEVFGFLVLGQTLGSSGKVVVNGGTVIDELTEDENPDNDWAPSTLDMHDLLTRIGGGGTGELRVVAGGQAIARNFGTQVGFMGAGSLEVSGFDSLTGNVSTYRQTEPVAIFAVGVFAPGSVMISNGGFLDVASDAFIGRDAEPGLVAVDGMGMGLRSEFQSETIEIGTTGTLTLANGGWANVAERLTVNGIVNTRTGAVTVGNFEPVDNTLTIGPGGLLTGSGTIVAGAVHNFGGTIRFGNSPGTLTIDGDFAQNDAGTSVFEIGGDEPGVDFDQLLVSGDVHLDGNVILDFIDGFAPLQGQQFEILTVVGESQGSFSDVSIVGLLSGFEFDLSFETGEMRLLALNDGIAASCDLNIDTVCDVLDINLIYALGDVSTGISVPPAAVAYDLNADGVVNQKDIDQWLVLAGKKSQFDVTFVRGDANLDGQVDASDLNDLGINWLRTDVTSWAQADFDGDGDVDASDLNSIGVNWLHGTTEQAAVPEPEKTSLWLLVLFMIRRSNRNGTVRCG